MARASASSAPERPLNPFLSVVFPTALTLMLCNMDRIFMAVAVIPMAKEFGWPLGLQGIIQGAFLWGYMATQFLGGYLADRYGGKVVMAAGVAWFSIASLLLPLALSPPIVAAGLSVPAILAARCMVGLGEGVAMPSMSNLIATYIPKEAKARALGLSYSGFHGGNLLGLFLSPLLLISFGWRSLFYIYGFIGAPLLALWMSLVPSYQRPSGSKGVGSGSSSFRGLSSPSTSGSISFRGTPSPSVKDLLSSSAVWAVIIVTIVNHWGYFIYLNWMPTYFNNALGFDLRSSSLLSFLPWLVMATGSSLAGFIADALVKSGWQVVRVRKTVQTFAFLVPAVSLVVLSQPGLSPFQAVAAMTVALGTTSLGQAGFVANMSDIAPKHAGQMFGLCNTFGSLSGIIGVSSVGFIVEATKSFSAVFLMTASLYVFGTVFWLCFCKGEQIF